jgi:hypothetical protein
MTQKGNGQEEAFNASLKLGKMLTKLTSSKNHT